MLMPESPMTRPASAHIKPAGQGVEPAGPGIEPTGARIGLGSPAARRARGRTARIRAAVVALACSSTLLAPASALATHSVGTPEQIAWVRRAASNFVAAELSGNGAGACGILNAPLRATEHHRTCAQRWDAKLAALLHERGGRARLSSEQRAIPSSVVIVHGDTATLALATPLAGGPNRFLWTENCWMLEG